MSCGSCGRSTTLPAADAEALLQEAQRFAADLTDTVSGALPGATPFLASIAGTRLVVGCERMALCVRQQHVFDLEVEFRCAWDHRSTFLAVTWSQIVVRVADHPEPLIRVEYEKNAHSKPPSHIQIHGVSDAYSYAASRANVYRTAGRRKTQLSDMHLPTGGHRFRPCLEDVIDMLHWDFGIELVEGAAQSLERGRAKWREIQLRSSVRDDPIVAADALRSFGYTVQSPAPAS